MKHAQATDLRVGLQCAIAPPNITLINGLPMDDQAGGFQPSRMRSLRTCFNLDSENL
jgi:hypothetical protein